MTTNERIIEIYKAMRQDRKNKELKSVFLALHRKQFEEMQASGELEITHVLSPLVRSCPCDTLYLTD